MAFLNLQSIKTLPHHKKEEICTSRAKYRDGRKDTAVKVYTINQESVYLLIQGVPAVGAQSDLQALCEQYGEVDFIQPLDEYPCEEFTEVYVVKYHWFPAARTAKKHLDDKSFFGGTLHVCYAPEFETVSDTRQKLQERRKFVAWKTKTTATETASAGGQNKAVGSRSEVNESSSFSVKRKADNQIPSYLSVTSCEPVTYIWAGKEYTVYPQAAGSSYAEQCADPSVENLSNPVQASSTSQPFIPRQLCTGVRKTSQVVKTNFGESACAMSNSNKSEGTAPCSKFTGTVNPGEVKGHYTSSDENIKNKLLSVAVPNVKVSFKRRKRI